MRPSGVILAMRLASLSENQILPSGPRIMPSGPASGVGSANSAMSPRGVMRPILSAAFSANHRLPSAPSGDADRRRILGRQGEFGETCRGPDRGGRSWTRRSRRTTARRPVPRPRYRACCRRSEFGARGSSLADSGFMCVPAFIAMRRPTPSGTGSRSCAPSSRSSRAMTSAGKRRDLLRRHIDIERHVLRGCRQPAFVGVMQLLEIMHALVYRSRAAGTHAHRRRRPEARADSAHAPRR